MILGSNFSRTLVLILSLLFYSGHAQDHSSNTSWFKAQTLCYKARTNVFSIGAGLLGTASLISFIALVMIDIQWKRLIHTNIPNFDYLYKLAQKQIKEKNRNNFMRSQIRYVLDLEDFCLKFCIDPNEGQHLVSLLKQEKTLLTTGAVTFLGACCSAALQEKFAENGYYPSLPKDVIAITPKSIVNEITICCHGYGQDNSIVSYVAQQKALNSTCLVGFNFPDHTINTHKNHANCAYGTLYEILPLLNIINYYTHHNKGCKINLYGFSAGAGAIINTLAILNQKTDKCALESISICEHDISDMLDAIERGSIILDCPLRSVDEIIAFRGETSELKIMAEHYNKNHLNPINSLSDLSGLSLNIILYFQKSDDVLGNRDEQLFIDRLRQANKGQTKIIIGTTGTHNGTHDALWNYLRSINRESI